MYFMNCSSYPNRYVLMYSQSITISPIAVQRTQAEKSILHLLNSNTQRSRICIYFIPFNNDNKSSSLCYVASLHMINRLTANISLSLLSWAHVLLCDLKPEL
ncbi:hypothetical protein GDO78_020908 [Eleutherodactylus coqui]|uniref:Uncharacterized protein n=1 Tax=Eleutherodactylus coqui TaxID=57060 RepID=A0A8J6BCR9_ELECQ|nr:hypothetical protein GDO78_020908 [Eleutherodactylus coqui]